MHTPTAILFAIGIGCAAVAQSPLETTFAGGLIYSNPPPAAVTQYFDLQITNPQGLVLTQIDMNYSTTSAPTGNFDVWMTAIGGTHVGNDRNPAPWTLLSAQAINVSGGRTAVTLTSPIPLLPGTYGVALHSVGFNPSYTNPNSASLPAPLPPTYSNADMLIDMSAGRSRSSDPLDPFGGTATGFSPRHANIALHYTVGVVALDFTADVTGGPSPLTVQFTGIGVSGNPGGILAWAWDFENDGTIDSTLQSPTHVYPCGTYTVSLTMVDAAGTYNETKVDYIETDILRPDYSVVAAAPNTLLFTDQTTPTPTSWAWDFDNDGTVDSTQQNPLFTSTAPFCSELDVVLTVQRACRPPVSLNKETALAKSISSRFDGGVIISSGATGGANLFDLQVTNPLGISVCALHTHTTGGVGSGLTYEIHLTDGTWVGNENNPDAWQLVSTATATGAGGGDQTFVALPQSLYLAPGSYGVALYHIGASPRYNSIGATQTFGNADVTLTLGATQAEPLFAGTLYSPRIGNVGIYYTDCAFTSEAGYGWFGDGCQNSLGVVPTNTATALPRLGQTMTAEISDTPIGVAFMSLGLSRTVSAFGPLPVDLAVFGAPGCFARVSPDSNSLLIGAPGGPLAFNLPIPSTTALLCTQFYTQGLALDSNNALGVVASDAAAAIVGQ